MTEFTHPRQNFIEIAKSYAGCYGGNPKARYYCWDRATGELQIREPVRDFPCLSPENPKDAIALKSYFACHLKLVIGAIRGVAPDTIKLADREGDHAWLNLYPLRKESTDSPWSEEHGELTGFDKVSEYYRWCDLNRASMFRELVKQGGPKVIVGFGKTRRSKFISSFAALYRVRKMPPTPLSEHGVSIEIVPVGSKEIDFVVIAPAITKLPTGMGRAECIKLGEILKTL